MKIRTIFNAKDFNDDEINNFPSETIPDQSMSIRTLLQRYANGLPLGGVKESIYEGEDGDGIDPRTLDLADRQEMEIAARQELAEIEERLKSSKAEKVKAKLTPEQIQEIES